MSLETKVEELCRRVLGGDAVVYIDHEAALDAVMARLDREALTPGNDGDSLTKLRQSVDEVEGDVRYIRGRLDDLTRAGKQ